MPQSGHIKDREFTKFVDSPCRSDSSAVEVVVAKFSESPVVINISLNPRGEYDNTETYEVGDSVSFNGSSYVAINSTTGNDPTDTNFWQLLSEKGDQGDPGEGLTAGGATGQILVKQSPTDFDTDWEDLDAAKVGLENVDNTSDADKPISTATQNALNLKYDNSNPSGFETPSQLDNRDIDNRDRSNHTGTQTSLTISDFDVASKNIVDSEISNHVAETDPHNQYTLKTTTTLLQNQVDDIGDNTISTFEGGLDFSGNIKNSPSLKLNYKTLTYNPFGIELTDDISFGDTSDGNKVKRTSIVFFFDIILPQIQIITDIISDISTNTSAIGVNNSKVSADGSINTHSDVDTNTIAPNNFTFLVWNGTNWVPANAIGSNSVNLNKQLVLNSGGDPQANAALIVNVTETSGDAFLLNNFNSDEVFSIRTNNLNNPNIVITNADGDEIAIINQNGLRLFDTVFINELSDDENLIDESKNAVVSERAIAVSQQAQDLAIATKEDIFDPNTESKLFDDFFIGEISKIDWSILESGLDAIVKPSSYGVNSSQKAIGAISLNTGRNSSGNVSISKELDKIVLGYAEIDLKFRIALPNLNDPSERYVVYAGLMDIAALGPATDGIYFVYPPVSANWSCVTRSNNVQTTISSPSVVNTNYNTFRILINQSAAEANFFINDVLVGTSTTNIPSGTTRKTGVVIKIQKLSGTLARSIEVDYYYHKISISGGRQ